ncbi:MAG: polyprenyl synthetase family protein [Chitinispirillaceae bacterium]|nr:polyprenyl synthetase family protein [Chitinispirillaceae bacterium]
MVTARFIPSIKAAFREALHDLKTARIGGLPSTALYKDIAGITTGKMLRPQLFLYLLEHNGTVPTKEHFRIAAGIELIHQFACIHDDIVDTCDGRRGAASLHCALERHYPGKGVGAALVAADGLFSHGLQIICATSCIRNKPAIIARLLEYASLTAVGQYQELVESTESERRLLDIYALKTACYTFVAPAMIAGELTGMPCRRKKKLERASLRAGKAYQLINDLKDIGCNNDTGMHCFNDFRTKKVNFIYLRLRKAASVRDREVLHRCWENGDTENYRRLLEKYDMYLTVRNTIDRLVESIPPWLRQFIG